MSVPCRRRGGRRSDPLLYGRVTSELMQSACRRRSGGSASLEWGLGFFGPPDESGTVEVDYGLIHAVRGPAARAARAHRVAFSNNSNTCTYDSPVAFFMPSSHVRLHEACASAPHPATSAASGAVAASVSSGCSIPRSPA